ncbi:MAG TPA: ABC transporter ATP-binding protein [Bdellovibrionales bacterium]|nr:ABC transporter ATP-binding protein [Bdellovibrionales bacterium]
MSAAIKIQHLSRAFGSKLVLNDVSLAVAQGERVGLCGLNGSGKTTLLNILNTTITPDFGEAWVAEHGVRTHPDLVRVSIAWMPSTLSGFVPRFTGDENLRFFAAMDGVTSERLQSTRARWLEVPLARETLLTPYSLCSDGMKRILSAMRALQRDTPVVILDEPFANLDGPTRAALTTVIREVTAGRTVLATAHSDNELADIVNRCSWLEGGRIRE